MREIIFISHATPEDNDFTVWLASRLRFLGYNVWYDKAFLLGGEKFWQTIDQVIRNEAIKFLFVYSEKVCSCPGVLKDGIAKEFYLAESIAKQEKIEDFIIPLNLGAPYNHFIGIEVYNQIPFEKNWAEGLAQLQEKLIKDQVPRSNANRSSDFAKWYQDECLFPASQQVTNNRKEKYFTSWWRIPNLPEFFYVYKFTQKDDADVLYKQRYDYPVAKITNLLISFLGSLDFKIDYGDSSRTYCPDKIIRIKTSEVLNGIEREGYPSRLEAENYLKVLLQRVFHLIMRNRNLQWYNLANRRPAYFYTPKALASGRVEIRYDSPKKTKRKSLFGEFHHNFYWHFAISGRPILFPFLAFNLKTHLSFTTDKYNLIVDKAEEIDTAKMHSFRRKKGRTFFNDSWRDLLLAFLHGVAKQEDTPIEICVAPCFVLNFSSFTESYWADFGYLDPGADRQDILYSDNDLNDECNNDVMEGQQT